MKSIDQDTANKEYDSGNSVFIGNGNLPAETMEISAVEFTKESANRIPFSAIMLEWYMFNQWGSNSKPQPVFYKKETTTS